MKIELCGNCGRPLWENLCAYCRGYLDGVKDAKNRKINKEIVSIEKLELKEGDTFPTVSGADSKLIDYKFIK